MNVNRRTQEERSAATRTALVAAGRRLWGTGGYAAVGTPEIAAAAGVTRGALYHQFADKTALFLAVVEDVEADVMARLTTHLSALAEGSSPALLMREAARRWLAIAVEPEVRQILLLDAPSVLGWQAYREVGRSNALGGTEELLGQAMEAGELPRQPLRVLSHVLVGAMDEAALVIATSDEPERATAEVGDVLDRLFDGLFRTPGG